MKKQVQPRVRTSNPPGQVKKRLVVNLEDDMLEPLQQFIDHMGCQNQAEAARIIFRQNLSGNPVEATLIQARSEGIRQGRQWIIKRITTFLSDTMKEIEAMGGLGNG